MKYAITLLIILSIPIVVSSQIEDYNGFWKGHIVKNDSSILIELRIYNGHSKSGLRNSVVSGLLYKPEMYSLEDNSNNDTVLNLISPSRKYGFKGSITLDKNKMAGVFTYLGKEYSLNLSRGEKVIFRPQEPRKPYPYRSEDISFINTKDSVTLSGTLTIPYDKGLFPAAILIHGSSPMNRDGASLNYHKYSLVIADYLTRKGIAVLRYDDRGVNESQGDYYKSTPIDFTGDVSAGFNLLKSRRDIDKDKIGLIGHSSGGIVSAIVASQHNDIGFVVLLASLGIDGKEDILLQTDNKFKVGDITAKQYAFYYRFYNKCYNMIEKGYDQKNIKDTLSRFKDEFLRLIPDSKLSMESEFLFNKLVQIQSSPNICFYIQCKPSIYFEKVTCPVLSLNGSNDNLVPATINQQAIKKALEKANNPNFKIIEIKDLNHNFQECKTGSIKESIEIEQTFSPAVLSLITEWILNLNKN